MKTIFNFMNVVIKEDDIISPKVLALLGDMTLKVVLLVAGFASAEGVAEFLLPKLFFWKADQITDNKDIYVLFGLGLGATLCLAIYRIIPQAYDEDFTGIDDQSYLYYFFRPFWFFLLLVTFATYFASDLSDIFSFEALGIVTTNYDLHSATLAVFVFALVLIIDDISYDLTGATERLFERFTGKQNKPEFI